MRRRFCGSIEGDFPLFLPLHLLSEMMTRLQNGGNTERFLFVVLLCVRMRPALSRGVKCQRNDLAPGSSAAEGACLGQPRDMHVGIIAA